MNYNNRTYPHPVLGINKSIDDLFEVNLKVSADKGLISIGLEYNLSNKDLAKLIEARQAAYCMQQYCKGTLYREVFRSYKPLPLKIKIPSTRLHEQVDADFFICACDDIPDYTNSSLSDDYKGYTYLIEKEYLGALPNMNSLISYYHHEKQYKVSKESMITYKGQKYSVPVYHIGNYVNVQENKDDLKIYYANNLITTHSKTKKFLNYKKDHVVDILRSDAFKHSEDIAIERFIETRLKTMDMLIDEGGNYDNI